MPVKITCRYNIHKTTSMNLTLLQASKKHATVLQHLMQFYMYDFSVYTYHDVEESGLFALYPGLESYWDEEGNKFPYIIIKEDKYVGFALVKRIETGERSYFSMAEFFILRKYRLAGMGKTIATQLFTIHKGPWEVCQMSDNKPAQLFWNRVIKSFTNGKITQRIEDGRRIQNFES